MKDPRTCPRAKGNPRQRHVPGVMNSLERRYAKILDERKHAGEIVRYWFESWKFKMGDNTHYTPDFVVMLPDGTLEVHETKGFMQDDASLKIRMFATLFPFDVWVIRFVKKEWEIKKYLVQEAVA